MSKLYLAYGSNLNKAQMAFRCPDAVPVGKTKIPGYHLVFRRGVLTIEPCVGEFVPVAVWKISEADEKALDRYEGFPDFYYKKEFRVQYKGILTGRRRTITAFAYIMHEDRPIGVPGGFYMKTCLEGYDTFGFDRGILLDAYDRSVEACGDEGL